MNQERLLKLRQAIQSTTDSKEQSYIDDKVSRLIDIELGILRVIYRI